MIHFLYSSRVCTDGKRLDNHEQRIAMMEKRRGGLWDRLDFALIGALATGVIGCPEPRKQSQSKS